MTIFVASVTSNAAMLFITFVFAFCCLYESFCTALACVVILILWIFVFLILTYDNQTSFGSGCVKREKYQSWHWIDIASTVGPSESILENWLMMLFWATHFQQVKKDKGSLTWRVFVSRKCRLFNESHEWARTHFLEVTAHSFANLF